MADEENKKVILIVDDTTTNIDFPSAALRSAYKVRYAEEQAS